MHMDRAIFNLGLSVEATSLYILICALLDQKEVPTLNRARIQWNDSEEKLLSAVEELAERGVVARRPAGGDDPLRLNARENWGRC